MDWKAECDPKTKNMKKRRN